MKEGRNVDDDSVTDERDAFGVHETCEERSRVSSASTKSTDMLGPSGRRIGRRRVIGPDSLGRHGT